MNKINYLFFRLTHPIINNISLICLICFYYFRHRYLSYNTGLVAEHKLFVVDFLMVYMLKVFVFQQQRCLSFLVPGCHPIRLILNACRFIDGVQSFNNQHFYIATYRIYQILVIFSSIVTQMDDYKLEYVINVMI